MARNILEPEEELKTQQLGNKVALHKTNEKIVDSDATLNFFSDSRKQQKQTSKLKTNSDTLKSLEATSKSTIVKNSSATKFVKATKEELQTRGQSPKLRKPRSQTSTSIKLQHKLQRTQFSSSKTSENSTEKRKEVVKPTSCKVKPSTSSKARPLSAAAALNANENIETYMRKMEVLESDWFQVYGYREAIKNKPTNKSKGCQSNYDNSKERIFYIPQGQSKLSNLVDRPTFPQRLKLNSSGFKSKAKQQVIKVKQRPTTAIGLRDARNKTKKVAEEIMAMETRIKLLQQQEEKAWKKIEETKKKTMAAKSAKLIRANSLKVIGKLQARRKHEIKKDFKNSKALREAIKARKAEQKEKNEKRRKEVVSERANIEKKIMQERRIRQQELKEKRKKVQKQRQKSKEKQKLQHMLKVREGTKNYLGKVEAEKRRHLKLKEKQKKLESVELDCINQLRLTHKEIVKLKPDKRSTHHT